MRRTIAALATGCLLLAGCSDGAAKAVTTGSESTESDPAPETSPDPERPDGRDNPDPDDAALDVAVSEPREDSVYPDIGDPSVDALHYDLTLDWDPESDTLTGTEVLTFRATKTAEEFQLDFGETLAIESLLLDGEKVEWEKDGKDLRVTAPVRGDERYELELAYAGTPRPVEAPTTRSDFNTTGFTITDDHETWTMQEPYGAFTWYAVNDQPSDKALYDFTLTVPSPWSGVANGELVSSDDDGTTSTNEWHLAEPASSYLSTLAFGDYEMTEDQGPGGVPITYWVPQGDEQYLAGLETSPEAMEWLEQYLGPYPFDTAGILVVDSESGMETQTMITLGDTDYSTGANTVVHEFAHQWYGDQVTPNDWRDVWMNEGMAMYLQIMWEAEESGLPLEAYIESYAGIEADERANAGPPGDFDPGMFGSGNIYFGGAFMWHELRSRLGDDAFFRVIREWPRSQDNTSSDREELEAWFEKETGEELTAFFDDWLLGEETPPRG